MNALRYFLVALGLSCGNFIYGAIVSASPFVAAERSFFQAVALLVAWIYLREAA